MINITIGDNVVIGTNTTVIKFSISNNNVLGEIIRFQSNNNYSMRVLYDYQAFNQHHGGVSRYHIELIKHLTKLGVYCEVPFLLSENVYLDEIGIKHINPLSNWRSNLRLNGMKWINQKICLSSIKRGNFDIFHPTFLNPYYVNYTKGIPVVQTMHDLIHEKIDRYDSKIVREKRKKVLNNADAIICISKETWNDLVKYYDVPESKLHLVYHGSEQSLISCNEKSLFDFPYLLYIGNRAGYKNFEKFLHSFAKLPKDIYLVCTGESFNYSECKKIKELGLSKRVYQKFVTEEEMKVLLCNATAFVYPSLMEGFGLPILEAFRCQCPCLISDISCFHEVGGKAAVYFNPDNVDDMTCKITQTIYDEEKLAALKNQGVEQLKKFTWDNTAQETLKVYKSFFL